MRSNKAKAGPKAFTHGGAAAFPHTKPVDALRRSVMSCLLWENEFYEDGKAIAARIQALAAEVTPEELAAVAIEAREQAQLRHVPLWLLVALAKHGAGSRLVGDTVARVVQRADELGELVSLYWKANPPAKGKKRTPLSAQLKRGLAEAFGKFDTYQLAKYDRDVAVKLRDVMFLVHPNPKNIVLDQSYHGKLDGERQAREEVMKKLAERTLESPDTWEVSLSGGADKKETFTRLLTEGKLGYLALLRNLRNMEQAGVDRDLVKGAILARKGAHRVLPFRFLAAAKHAKRYEEQLDQAMVANLSQQPKLSGRTVIVVDISGSMGANLSAKSDMSRMDAACALAAIARELCVEPIIYATAGNDSTRKHRTELVPARHGMALVDAIQGELYRKLGGGGIFLKQVMDHIHSETGDVDRVIVVTDEQDCGVGASDKPANAKIISPRNYMLNVGSYKNGIGYKPHWTHIDGFSENVFRYIEEYEAAIERNRN